MSSPKCILCHSTFTQKTLNKYDGKHCKTCHYTQLLLENKMLLTENQDLHKKINLSNSQTIAIKFEKLQKIIQQKHILVEHHRISGVQQEKDILLQKDTILQQKNIILEQKDKIQKMIHNLLLKNNIFYDQETPDDFCGIGKYYNSNTTLIYNGEWKNGSYNGNGKEYTNHGELLYEGNFKNDEYHDEGTLYFKNGEKYSGTFVNGNIQGYGVYHFNGKGNIIYKGNWTQGQRTGSGRLYLNNEIRYEAEWKNGSRIKGKEFKNNNVIYEGEWNKGRRNGYGKLYKDNNLIYDGQWTNDMRNGKGKSYDKNHITYDGDWDMNEKHGYGTEYDTNNIVKEGIWKSNLYQGQACIICFAEVRCMAFVPCGHLCICEKCADKYNDDKCILCRKEFSIPHKIYFN